MSASFKRFCIHGHDKLAPHNLYIKAEKNRIHYICAVCARIKRHKRWMEKRK